MYQKIKILLLSIAILIQCNAYAQNLSLSEQKFIVANNMEVKAYASKTEITRIAFETPVIEIHAISEELEYVINGKDIYLRITTDKPINFFVKCEDEMTYKLVLIAEDIPATQVFINNQKLKTAGNDSSKFEYFAKSSPELKTRIAKIIKIALSPTKYLGYSETPKNLTLHSYIKDLKLKLETIVSGNHLIAEKIYLTSKANKPIKLNLKDFIEPKYLAVYLDDTEILHNQKVILLRVFEN